jgi:hypothetical protein
MSISRWIVAVADSILLAAAVLMLIAVPVSFMLFFAPDARTRVASPPGLADRPPQTAVVQPSCLCMSSELDAANLTRPAWRRPDGTP